MDRRVVKIKGTDIGKGADGEVSENGLYGGVCLDCGTSFMRNGVDRIYSVFGLFRKGQTRCHNCRVLRRTKYGGNREGCLSVVVCAACYQLTYLSFRPNGQNPIYCASCFQSRNIDLGVCAG